MNRNPFKFMAICKLPLRCRLNPVHTPAVLGSGTSSLRDKTTDRSLHGIKLAVMEWQGVTGRCLALASEAEASGSRAEDWLVS